MQKGSCHLDKHFPQIENLRNVFLVLPDAARLSGGRVLELSHELSAGFVCTAVAAASAAFQES